MIATIIITLFTSFFIIASVLLFPRIKIKNISIDSYWLIALLGALLIVSLRLVSTNEIVDTLLANNAINPIKILVLFISMSTLSIYLDEVGFFRYIANYTIKVTKGTQISMFITFNFVIAILTIFTSNDIIILTFTPFICYFAKNAKISPIPFLVSEFVSANTWSMILVIGNPTNIYLATMYNITFIEYLKVMLVPGIMAGFTSFAVLYLMFRKELKKPLEKINEDIKISNKYLVIIGLIHLGLCTILLSISSYIGFEMWLITLLFALSLFINVFLYKLFKKDKSNVVIKTLQRTPWSLIPFVISMFIIVLSLDKYNVTSLIANILGDNYVTLKYGLSSFLSANLVNNIPMSVIFSSILKDLNGTNLYLGVYATIIGSNIGAYLTPIGALAGIMWMNILKKEKVDFGFFSFIKKHLLVSIITLLVSLLFLYMMINFIY